jgi:hypothetical protein
MDFTTLFCDIHDFVQIYTEKKKLIAAGKPKKNYPYKMHDSEIVTILIWFHLSGYRNFKNFYISYIGRFHAKEFPNLVSYNRFVELKSKVFAVMCAYLCSKFGKCTGISFIDSTKLSVCGNKRITRNKVFKEIAKIGKTSMGWFYGFKLHIIVNEFGELLSIRITAGNVNDRTPVLELTKNLFGKLFGDKGYISCKLTAKLLEKGIKLITNLKKNMKNKLMPLYDKILLRKRSLIETINDQLKNIFQIEHTRHRNPNNFIMNLLAGLVAYAIQPKKPGITSINNNNLCLL